MTKVLTSKRGKQNTGHKLSTAIAYNNVHFKLLISSVLGERVIAYASKIYKEDQQRTDSNRCLEKSSTCLTRSCLTQVL